MTEEDGNPAAVPDAGLAQLNSLQSAIWNTIVRDFDHDSQLHMYVYVSAAIVSSFMI